MIPILYDSTEVSFTSNGLGRLADCISCTVTEERNGIYECQFQYPITGEMYPLIQEGCILGVIHDDVKDIQPFDIYSRSAPLNGVVTFYAHHISYRLGNVILKPMTATSCAEVFSAIPNQTYTECPFTFWTDKAVSSTWTNEVPSSVKAILGGQQGSILDVYGKGEYEFDKWFVRLYVNRGNDNGVSIRYGVNLTDLTQELDTSTAYTAVVPYWLGDEGELVTLPEGYVAMDGLTVVPVPLDLSSAFETAPTIEQLRTKATDVLTSSEAWLPKENIRISFVDLSHTEEYKNVAALQRVRLCDKVSVYCGPLGVSAVSMKVVRVIYNVLTERYDEIELGKAKVSFAQTITASVEEITKDLPSVSMMQRAINNATDKITGANGGHVRFVYDANGDPQEILIMDTDDISTATNIWRWNSGGLGFSSNGYSGPYALAMTADGQIVADMITTGELSANIIKTGVLDGELVKLKLLQVIDEVGNTIASFSDTLMLGNINNSYLTVSDSILSFYSRRSSLYPPISIIQIGNNGGRGKYKTYSERFTGNGVKRIFKLAYRLPGATNPRNLSINTERHYTVWNGSTGFYGYGNYLNVTEITFDEPLDSGETIIVTYELVADIPFFNFGVRNGLITYYGQYSMALGHQCGASNLLSTAFGYQSKAIGGVSYAEGYASEAVGDCSHAEGAESKANAFASHAEGYRTIASGQMQHVFGSLNIADSSYLEIVGNGTKTGPTSVETRKNARTLDWNGNEWIAGALSVGNVSQTLRNLGFEAGAFVSGVKGDNESTYRAGTVNLTPSNLGAKETQSAVSDPTASGTAVSFIATISQNAQGVISPTKKTVQGASQSAAGLMSAADKKKLDGVEVGAQVNSVSSVNGQTGAVSVTPANIGALPSSGGTVTGAVARKIDKDFDTPPSSQEYTQVLPITDEDNAIRGGVYMVRNTDGSYQAIYGAYKPGVGWNYIAPKINADDSFGFDVNHPEALLSAIGVRWKKVTGTTSAGGTVSLGLAKNRYMVVSVWSSVGSGSSHICTPLVAANGTNWLALVETVSHAAVANTSVTLYVGYIDFGAGNIS